MGHLRTIIPYYRPYRWALAAGLLCVVVAQAFTIAGPWILKLAIDSLGDPAATRSRIAGLALTLVGVAVLGGAARFGMRELINGVSRRIEVDLRNDFFRHLLGLDASFYSSTRTGDLMSRATHDTLAVRQAAGPAVMYSVNTAVGFVLALALMLWISPQLTTYAVIPLIVLPPVVLGFGRIIHRRFEEIQEQYATLSTMIQENLTGMRIVRAYTQEEAQAGQFDELNQAYRSRNMQLVKAAGLFHPLLRLFSGAGMVIVLWLGGLEVMAGRITVGDYVAFFFYLSLLIWPMIALGWVVNMFQRGAASMGRLNAILDREPAVAPPEATSTPALPIRLAEVGGEIEFRNVYFRYPDTSRDVLIDVSFTARAGQTVAVVGATGSGKSTLISLIPRLFDPTEGLVLLDGIPLCEIDPSGLRAVMGVVPQDSFLFSETIHRNIALGLPDERGHSSEGPSHRVEGSARVAQLHDSILGFPRGYETLLGERGINLSGGQKQRATLARALARDPRILILDDALSAVDTHTEARILEDLRNELKQRTAFIISHRVSAVMNADLILVLEDGRIAERGTHDELLAAGGVYATLLRRQMLEQEIEEEVTPAAAGD